MQTYADHRTGDGAAAGHPAEQRVAVLPHINSPVRLIHGDGAASIERLTDHSRWPDVDRLVREYVPWVAERLAVEHGLRFPNADHEIERHHAAFAGEKDQLLTGRGRLLLGHMHGQPAGLVALKPVDAHVAEVKRLYVCPGARGHGLARTLLQCLIAEARAEGFHLARLETMSFMTEARTLYASLGFHQVPAFEHSQSAMSGLASITQFMVLELRPVLSSACGR